MKLTYFTKTPNFGDALNPLLLNRIFPDFFDEDDSQIFLGIGSILHMSFPQAKEKIVFSTGYAYYGDLPVIDNTYHVACVRGPLTANALKLDPKLSITDGAALLKTFDFPETAKKYDHSFIPHHASALFYDWKKICEEAGYHYIDPSGDCKKVIKQIRQSKVVIAEAMHGAIVADTLRIPWIPVKLYPTINEFKWQDWTASLSMEYKPNVLASLYSKDMIHEKVIDRLRMHKLEAYSKNISRMYQTYQNIFLNGSVIKNFANLKRKRTFISHETILDLKIEQLLEKACNLKKRYESLQRAE